MERVPLNLLLIEDSESDAQQIAEQIDYCGFSLQLEQVYTRQGMLSALDSAEPWDIIITEHTMPGLSSTDVLLVLLERGIEVPLIIVSDHIAEEIAIESVRAGAHDFVMKDNLSRLGITITNALQGAEARRDAREYQQRLRELSVHLEEVRESERVDIAREIHDELGGMLTAIKMDVRWLHKKSIEQQFEAEEKFSLLGEHLDSAINSVRRIITDLRPSVLDDLGLAAALEWQLTEFEKRYTIKSRFDNRAPDLHIEDKRFEVAVFRIFQESLTNIAKHAQADGVEVTLAANNNILNLEIKDNGVGISEENKLKKGHYGILGMNERIRSIGGSLEISAEESGGTRVSLRLPLQQEGKQKNENIDRR
jgi:signal transduction histidine kinase